MSEPRDTGERGTLRQRVFGWCVPREAVEWPRLTNGTVALLPWPHRVGSRNSHLTVRHRPPLLGWPADGRIYDCDESCIRYVTDDDGAKRPARLSDSREGADEPCGVEGCRICPAVFGSEAKHSARSGDGS